MKNDKPLYPELVAEMARQGYNQKTFCKKVGMSESQFSARLNGKTDFTIPEGKRIAEALEKTIEELFG